jgi:hypothetical protein
MRDAQKPTSLTSPNLWRFTAAHPASPEAKWQGQTQAKPGLFERKKDMKNRG